MAIAFHLQNHKDFRLANTIKNRMKSKEIELALSRTLCGKLISFV